MEKNFFQTLYDVDVRDRMYDKQGLAYIPWATAWSEVAKKYPDATYEIVKFGEKLLPYTESDLGIMVFTKVTIEGVTREMCLPVMDGSNKAMKSTEYIYGFCYFHGSLESYDLLRKQKCHWITELPHCAVITSQASFAI